MHIDITKHTHGHNILVFTRDRTRGASVAVIEAIIMSTQLQSIGIK